MSLQLISLFSRFSLILFLLSYLEKESEREKEPTGIL
jgi:hypothetical protein